VIFSLWLYARATSFAVFWQWAGWHYRFRWLVLAFAALPSSFVGMLFATELWMVIVAQVVFGFAVGLIYYSSLFYSVDVGETKTEHSGFHEAAIGLGTFAGPALGAATITLLPQQPGGGALAITGLLLTGLGSLIWLRLRKPKEARMTNHASRKKPGG
jgi:MFS family permease